MTLYSVEHEKHVYVCKKYPLIVRIVIEAKHDTSNTVVITGETLENQEIYFMTKLIRQKQ